MWGERREYEQQNDWWGKDNLGVEQRGVGIFVGEH